MEIRHARTPMMSTAAGVDSSCAWWADGPRSASIQSSCVSNGYAFSVVMWVSGTLASTSRSSKSLEQPLVGRFRWWLKSGEADLIEVVDAVVCGYIPCDSSFWSSTVSAKLLHCQVSARIPWRNLGSEPTVNFSECKYRKIHPKPSNNVWFNFLSINS